MAALLCEDALTAETEQYLRPQDLKELGDDSLPQEGYLGFSIGARSASSLTHPSMRSFSSDRSNTLNRTSYVRDNMMIEKMLAPSKDTHLTVTREQNECFRRYSWTPDTVDHAHNTESSPIHSGPSSPLPPYDSRFLVSFMVDARGGSMRGSRHDGMRIIIPPRKCPAPTRVTCRLSKRHRLAYPPPMVEGEGLVSRLVEVGPAGAHFLGPVIVEIPHFGSMREKERELIVLRSDNGDTWKEHHFDCSGEELLALLSGMDEELDSPAELEKKRICRIVTKDFPQYFAVVSRIKQESDHMGPEGGVLTSESVSMVRAAFPPGALTKKIRVGLQAQPVPEEIVRSVIGNRASFSPIVTVEPRRRKFHKPITMTIPIPPKTRETAAKGRKGDNAPCLRLLCSITGGTSPAQWEDITGTTPLSYVTDCVSFTTNVSARFWLADCHHISETVALAIPVYQELICVPYLAKFVVFAKPVDHMEAQLRCFCMTDDKVDKTLEQQENFEEVARSKDTEILEGKPIYVDCYGNLSPVSKTSQLVFNFYAFKENRLPFSVKVRDMGQEACGRLSFLKEAKTTKCFPQSAICNLNFTLPAHKKEMESDLDDENDKDRRHMFASLALRKRFNYLANHATKTPERDNSNTSKVSAQPSGYAYKPVFTPRSYQAWATSPPISTSGQTKSGFISLSSSSSNTPSASPLRSAWSLNSASPIRNVIGGSHAPSIKSSSDVASPVLSYRTMSSQKKTAMEQSQYPFQVSQSLLSSPGKNAPDSVPVKGLASFSTRTSPVPSGGSLLERSSITMTPPASPKSSLNIFGSTLPYKSVIPANAPLTASPIKTVPGLSSARTNIDAPSAHKGFLSSLSSPLKTNSNATAMINGTVSPAKYHSSSPTSFLSTSLQERIQATTKVASTSVTAAFDEAEKTLNSCSAGYGTLKSVSSSPSSSYQSIRSSGSNSFYATLRSPSNSTTSVTSTVTVPVFSVMNVLPEQQFKKLPDISKSTAALLSPKKVMPQEQNAQTQSPFARTLSPIKTPVFMSSGKMKPTTSSPLSSSQEILKDVHEMKEDLIRMSAILQTDPSSVSKSFRSDSPKEHKIEEEEPYKIVEKVKQDLVKVSEILSKDVLEESKEYIKMNRVEDDLEDSIDGKQQNGWRCPPRYETVAHQVKTRSMPNRDYNLAKVVDYLTNDIGTNSLSKIVEAKQRNEEVRRGEEEKQKRFLKPAMAVQEHKLKMPPSNMHSSPSEKELSRLADALFGTDVILDLPDDFSHDPEKSPLSDSGFETRSERTPSAPQSAEGTGPKALFQEVPPVISETRTEVVHVIRSYESPEDKNESVMDDVKIAKSPARCIDTEPRSPGSSFRDRVKAYQDRTSLEEDLVSKGMRLKEETHITTTTRMVYHKPASAETSTERFEETMSVRDIVKAFHSGQTPSKELTALFEQKGSNEGREPLQRHLDRDSVPKVERIIEVHIEKGNKMDPTEVIIRETKNHPEEEMYIYQSSSGMKELNNRAEVDKQEKTHPLLRMEGSQTTSPQLIANELYKSLKSSHEESSDVQRDSKKLKEKMLFAEKLDSSHSDSDESVIERSCYYDGRTQGGSIREFMLKPDKPDRLLDDNENCEKLSLLKYASSSGSPKKSIWLKASEDRQGKMKEKMIYEDRVDRTVKEAEEKLSEVSQFFRDKTEKLNDELQSPEKKHHRQNSRETQSGPSSTCSSPERIMFKNSGNGEEWTRDKLRDRYSVHDRKCASLPSSPERQVLVQHSEDDKKQGDLSIPSGASEYSKCIQPLTSKVSSVRMKFEAEAQKQNKVPQSSHISGSPVRKLQESKLPIYQVFAGNVPKSAASSKGEHGSKEDLDTENVRRTQTQNQSDRSGNVSNNDVPKHQQCVNSKGRTVDKNKNIFKSWDKDHSNNGETPDKIIYTELMIREDPDRNASQKKNSESQIPVRVSSSFIDHHQSSTLKVDSSVKSDGVGSHIPLLAKSKHHSSSSATKSFSDVLLVGSTNKVCNGIDSEQIEYIERVTPSVEANIKPLPVYVSIEVGEQYEKETAETGQLSTYKKVVSHESRTVHETRGMFYTVKQKQQPSPKGIPEDDTLEQVTFMESSGRSPVTPETPSSEEVSCDLNSRAPESVIGSMTGMPSPILEESEEEEQPKTFIFKELPEEKAKHETPNRHYESSEKRSKDKRVAYIEFPPPPPLEGQQSEKVEVKMWSCASSKEETGMIEVNLQEEHDRHLLAEPIIRVHPPSPLPPGTENTDSSDDESVFQPIPLKKYTFKMTEEAEKRVRPRKPERNGSNHKESSINGVIKGDEMDDQNGDQSITDCSIATTAEFSHDTDATEIDSLDGYDLQEEDDGLNDPKTSSLSNDGKTGDQSFSQSKLEVIEEESTPNEDAGEKAKSNSKKTGNGKNQDKIYSLEGRHPEREESADSYFSYKLEDELNTTFKTVAVKGLDFDPWSSQGGEEGVFDSKGKDEDPKPFGLSVEDKSQATTPDTTPARTPTDESTPTSEPNPFPFHEGKMFEMTRSGAIDMSKRDFVEERLQFFQIGEHTANGKSGDKGKMGRSVVVGASQSKAGERTVEGMVEATTDITPSKDSPAQGSTGCLDAPPCTDTVGETTSCTVTASKVDPKLRTPIKMGIAASITIKKDSGSVELSDFKADSSASHMPEYVSLETHSNNSQFSSRSSDSPTDRKDYLSENCNNNNNLEASSVQANYIQCGSVVFNLQSSSEPTLQKASRIDAHVSKCSIESVVDKSSALTLQEKADSQKEVENKGLAKSRLPIKAAGFAFNSQSSGKQKPKQAVKPEARKLDSASNVIEHRSRIPVKAVGPRPRKLGEAETIRTVVSSQLPIKDDSSGTISNGSVKADRTKLSELGRQSVRFLQSVSGGATKVLEHLSDEEKQKQAEQSEEDSSTSRSTSLSDPSQSQPSLSVESSRGVAPSRSKVIRSAGSERRRTRLTRGGKEGSRAKGARGSPPIAEIKPRPQSPCERTDLRMAIVADHLGLSWTELAREMNFTVDEINHIRMENPNSLTAQSFMLLKKWVSRDGKNATTDALTAVLTKVNRMDIVTLLEGPIFDYGNISGTRRFADDSAVEKADGYFTILAELQSSSELHSAPHSHPTTQLPFCSESDLDLVLQPPMYCSSWGQQHSREEATIDCRTITPTRPSNLALFQPQLHPQTHKSSNMHTHNISDPYASSEYTTNPSTQTKSAVCTVLANQQMFPQVSLEICEVSQPQQDSDVNTHTLSAAVQFTVSDVENDKLSKETSHLAKGKSKEESQEMKSKNETVTEEKRLSLYSQQNTSYSKDGKITSQSKESFLSSSSSSSSLSSSIAHTSGVEGLESLFSDCVKYHDHPWGDVIEKFVSGGEDEEERRQEQQCHLLAISYSRKKEGRVKQKERNGARDDEAVELEVCSLSAGWINETSGDNALLPTSGQSLSSDLVDRQDNSQENYTNSVTSTRGEAGKAQQNGEHSWDSTSGVKREAGRVEGTLLEHKVKGEHSTIKRREEWR